MLERILRFSIDHRWLVLLLTLAAGATGVWSLTRLPIDAVPDITNNQVQINTVYAALGPEQVEKQVTFPVETALAGIDGLDHTRSISRNGFSQVTAVFTESTDVYFARAQVLERLTQIGEELPPGAVPSMGPISTGLGEVFMYAVEFERPHAVADGGPGWLDGDTYLTPEGETLRSPVEKASYLRTLQDWVISPQLRQVPGVAGVDAIGGYEKRYGVEPDPMKLVARGLTFGDLVDALERNNAARGAGYVEVNGEALQVRASGLLTGSDDVAGIVIAESDGVPVRVSDVANVGIVRELRTGSASLNGEEAVIGTALMLIGGNSRAVAAGVGERLAEINATLPPGVRALPVLDRTGLVDRTIETVEHNLFFGAVLVIVVLFTLLGNLRAALITALAIPLSMLLTATGMVQAGISANLLSLGAIDFGIIVDGSVIIVENCVRRLAERQAELGRKLTLAERLETTFEASKQVRTATAFGEAIIITVYLPVLFLTGVEGKMFTPMAATVIFALVGAFVLSLTFVPAAVAVAMGGKVSEKEVFLLRWAKAAYEPIVRAAVRGRVAVVAAAVVALVASGLLFSTLGQEFIPRLDEGDIAMHAMRIPSTALASSQENQLMLERKLAAIPEVTTVFSKTGTAEVASDPMAPSVSDNFLLLADEADWRSVHELIAEAERYEAELPVDAHEGHDDHGEEGGHAGPAEDSHKGALVRLLRAVVATVPGNNYEFTQPIEMRFNELISGVRSDVAIKVFGDDFGVMLPAAEAIAARAGAGPRGHRREGRADRGPARARRRDRPRRHLAAGPERRRRAGPRRRRGGREGRRRHLPGRPPLRPDRPPARGASATTWTRCGTCRSRCPPTPRRRRSPAPPSRRRPPRPTCRSARSPRSPWPRASTRSAARTASGGSSCRPTSAAATSPPSWRKPRPASPRRPRRRPAPTSPGAAPSRTSSGPGPGSWSSCRSASC